MSSPELHTPRTLLDLEAGEQATIREEVDISFEGTTGILLPQGETITKHTREGARMISLTLSNGAVLTLDSRNAGSITVK